MNINDNNIVPHFDITISEYDNSILKILNKLRPEWDTAKIKIKFLTDGITNKLALCTSISKDGHAEDHLLVRIYGNKTDLLIDRKAEIRNIKILHNYDLAPKLYGTFENGLVYEFIPGNTVTNEDVIRPEMYKLIACEMAKMHKIKVPNLDKPQPNIWEKIQKFVDLIPDQFEDETKQKQYAALNFSKSQLLHEIQQFKEIVKDFDMPVVFSHNDLLLGNIIYNKTMNKVFFIDFEYADFNYQPYDIGNHFTEFSGVNEVDYSKFPNKDFQVKWLRTYLEEYKETLDISDHEIEILYVQVNTWVLAAHLLWYSWSLIQADNSNIDFDFIGYGGLRIKEYFKKKPEILSLKLPKTS